MEEKPFYLQLAEWIADEGSGIKLGGVPAGAVRQNDKRPAKMEFYVDDEWVKNATGIDRLVDGYYILKVPRELLDGQKLDKSVEKAQNTPADGNETQESA